MTNVWNRFKEFVGLGDEPVEDYEETDYSSLYKEQNPAVGTPEPTAPKETQRRSERVSTTTPARRPDNVIGMPNAAVQAELFVIEPKTFDDAPQLIQYLRERKSVVLNLTLMEAEQAQRTVDFIAGATYAIDGHQERLGDGIFLFTPSTVLINSTTNLTPVRSVPNPEGFKLDPDLWRSGT